MMLALAFVLIAQVATADLPVPEGPPSEAVAEQIIVIGERLKTFKGGVYKKDGKLTCRIEVSTGDEAIDMVRCGAMLRCFAPRVAEFETIAASAAPRAERNRRMQAIAEAAKPCLEEASAAGVRMLAEQRDAS